MLSAYITDPTELSTLEPQCLPEDWSYSPEADSSDDDLSDQPQTHVRRWSGYKPTDGSNEHRASTPAEIRADVQRAIEEEHPVTVERLWSQAEQTTLTPSVCMSRCWDLLEPRSMGSYKVALYTADVKIACRKALQCQGALLPLYIMLYEQNKRAGIPTAVLLRNPLVQQIMYLCGTRLRSLRLWNFSAYNARPERHNHAERRFAV